jgi:hypothetical protein
MTRRATFTEAKIARVLSVAVAQGLPIRSFEVSLDGRIVVHVGQAQTAPTESGENTCAGKFGRRP